MNKFEQVSGDEHQMSLVGVGMSRGMAMSGERGGYVRDGGLGCPYSSCGGKNANIANFVYHGKTLVTQLLRNMFLPPANDAWGKVVFLQLSVILVTGGSV